MHLTHSVSRGCGPNNKSPGCSREFLFNSCAAFSSVFCCWQLYSSLARIQVRFALIPGFAAAVAWISCAVSCRTAANRSASSKSAALFRRNAPRVRRSCIRPMRGQHGKRVDNPSRLCFRAPDPGQRLPTPFPHLQCGADRPLWQPSAAASHSVSAAAGRHGLGTKTLPQVFGNRA